MQKHKPDHAGYFLCGICLQPVHFSDMEVDHVEGRLGERLVDKNNLQTTHIECNRLKGSKKMVRKVSFSEYDYLNSIN